MGNSSQLYSPKQKILNKINQFFITNNSGYICVPTGWGKTFLSKHIIQQYINAGQRVLFLVSQNNHLLTQTATHKQQRVFPNSLILSSHHDKLDRNELNKYFRNISGCVVFASLQTLLSAKNENVKEILMKRVNLLIVDEIHNFIKNKGNEFIHAMPKECKVFGMTATPFQGILDNMKYVTEICPDMKMIHHEYLRDCIDNGTLSKIDYTIINSGQSVVDVFDFSHGLMELAKQELTMDCSTKDKIEAAIRRTRLAKKVYDTQSNFNEKALVFCSPSRGFKTTSFHAKLSALIFNNEPFIPKIEPTNKDILGNFKRAAFISSDMTNDEKQELMDNFRVLNKPPYVLCTVGMLVEGFNFPDLQNLILLRPTLSMRLFEQQLGRILRKPENVNKEWGKIYEVADNIDILYEKFNNQIFNPSVAEQLQILQPRIRFELLMFNNRASCEDTKNIKITEIRDKDTLHIAIKNSATNQQVKHLEKMIELLEKVEYGCMSNEHQTLQKVAGCIRMNTIDDVYAVVELIKKLSIVKQNAINDDNLSCSCKKNKPVIIDKLICLLKLNVAHKIEKVALPPLDRMKITQEIGCGDNMQVFKADCFCQGLSQGVENIRGIVSKYEQDATSSNRGNKVKQIIKSEQFLIKYYNNWLQFV